jgi:hypothetical protein
LLTLRLCQKNIWTSQIQHIDRRSELWWVSLHEAAIKASDRYKFIHKNYITPTDRQSFSRQDSCSANQEIPYKLPLGPYPKLSVSNPVSCNLLPKDLSSYYSPIHVSNPQGITSLQVFWQFCLHLPLLSYALHYMFYPYHTLIFSL